MHDTAINIGLTLLWGLFAVVAGGLISLVGVCLGSWIQDTLNSKNGPFRVTWITYLPAIIIVVILYAILSH